MDLIYLLEVLMNSNNNDFFEEVSRISGALSRNNLYLDIYYEDGGLSSVLFDDYEFNFSEINGKYLMTVLEGISKEELRKDLVSIVLNQIDKLNEEGGLK